MRFSEAVEALDEGKKVRLPEWRGYWFKDQDGEYCALTKDGDIVKSWTQDKGLKERTDWEIANGLDFGWAICALKAGKLVTRAGWNGKGMFLFIRPADELDASFVIDKVKSVPQSLKEYLIGQYSFSNTEKENGNNTVKFSAYICMKAADGSIVNGWLASQTDMLAEDWQLFEY